jgi:nucleoside permease NupC
MIGLFIQQAIALIVLKSSAGFHAFKWLATLASDFLNEGLVGAAFFFDRKLSIQSIGILSTRYVTLLCTDNE